MSQITRSRRYFAFKKEEKSYNRYLINQGNIPYNIVEKFKLKKGGKQAAEVINFYEHPCANLEYWEICP